MPGDLKWHKVRCSKCGKLKMTNPFAWEARLKKYGSLEEMEKTWVCRGCRKEVKQSQKEEPKTPAEMSERRKEMQKKANRIMAESIPVSEPEAN